MLDVKRMRVLREVIARGSFSAAADSLHLSQSAVSQQVAALEKEVGMQLLERTSEGPKLTSAGETLMGHADAVICRLEEAERDLTEIAGLESGRVRVISFPSASATVLTRAIGLFRPRFPAIDLELGEGEPEVSIPLLRAASSTSRSDSTSASTPTTSAATSSASCCSRRRCGWRCRRGTRSRPLTASSSQTSPTRTGSAAAAAPAASTCIRLCQEAGFEPSVSFDSDDYQVLKGLVSAGLGVTLLPELTLGDRAPGLELRPVSDKHTTRRVWAITREAASRSPATEAMVAVLVEAGKSYETAGLRGAQSRPRAASARFVCIRSAPGQRPDAAAETV